MEVKPKNIDFINASGSISGIICMIIVICILSTLCYGLLIIKILPVETSIAPCRSQDIMHLVDNPKK